MADSDDREPQDKPRGKHRGPDRHSPYPVSRLAPAFDLVDVAKEIQKADEMLGAVVGNQLEVIVDQIHALQEQARSILERAQRDADLHRAECAFQRRVGQRYHLWERDDGTLYFSMLSEDDWGGAAPHQFRGTYRLEADMSWTPAEEIPSRDQKRGVVRKMLGVGSGATGD
ncbi:MAG: DUF2452 domain-containing protein [Deltaproteobacteria bacterium]|nr:DUF2452 domain-containing protein [Deltaproteobacteria bacterium]